MSDTGAEATLHEAEKWSMGRPCLFASIASLNSFPLPTDIQEEDANNWNIICGHPVDGTVQFIASLVATGGNMSLDSIEASKRYTNGLPELVKKFPDYAPFLLLLAECHFLMFDTHGALDIAMRAREVMASMGRDDDLLNVAIKMLHVLAHNEMKEYGCEDTSITVFHYSRPSPWIEPSSQPPNLVDLKNKWDELQESGEGAEQFARYSCVESNQLEGVFCLDGDSSRLLGRAGLCMSSIEGISQHSRRKDPDKILSIIMNTQHCYNRIMALSNDNQEFSQYFLKELHHDLLHGDNVDVDVEKYENAIVHTAHLTPLGVYRRVPCFASHDQDGYQTRFCPGDRIEEEISWFVSCVTMILNGDNIDPYYAAAWIQHTYVRIHPFSDGNGRIGRLISSIPLLLSDLPPVFVSSKSKQEYFRVLKKADDTGNIDELAEFLQREAFNGIESLLNYVPSPRPIVLRRGPRSIRRISPKNTHTAPYHAFSEEEEKSEDGTVTD